MSCRQTDPPVANRGLSFPLSHHFTPNGMTRFALTLLALSWLLTGTALAQPLSGGAFSPSSLAGDPASEAIFAPAAQTPALVPQPYPPGPGWSDPSCALPPDVWQWQILPDGIIYPSYLAGTKESRFAAHIINAKDDGWLFDAVLGTRVGLIRFGDHNSIQPQGWQLDAEGAAQLRLDIPEEVDVRSADFRAGLPLTYGLGRHRFKIGYYHLSSHLGDEFLLKNPGFPRLNFSRDAFILGHMIYVTPQLRIYGEASWAFKSEINEPWEFQFGVDYLPCGPTGVGGAPFFAVNGHFREEVNFGGAVTAQAGWAWRGSTGTNLFRVGLHYYNGESNQYSFFDDHEEQIGFGVWYDF